MNWLIIAVFFVLVLVAISTYAVLFIFIHGSSPAQRMNMLKNLRRVVKTALTWGFAKASVRRFVNHYRLVMFPQPQAMMGCAAPDAQVVTLNGEVKGLVSDFIQKMPTGMPLVLNMGSYT